MSNERNRGDGAQLKALRRRLNLSIAAAALQCEVSARSWKRWESGKTVPADILKLFRQRNGLP